MIRRARTHRYISPPPLHEAGIAKHPHLKPEQHEERRFTALHEAAHFVTGIALGAGYLDVLVRVPDRSPRNGVFRRGVAGGANVHGLSAEHDAIIDLAAVLLELAVNPTAWQRRAASDLERTGGWLDKQGVSADTAIGLCDRALQLVVDHWSAIDGVAAAFLELGRRDGTVPFRRCSQIADYVRSGSWRGRQAHHSIPAGFYLRLDAIRDTDLAFSSAR